MDPALSLARQIIVSFETGFFTISILSGDRSGALGDYIAVLTQLSASLRQYGALAGAFWQIVTAWQKPGLSSIPILIINLTCITPSTTLATIQIRKKLVLALLVLRTPRTKEKRTEWLLNVLHIFVLVRLVGSGNTPSLVSSCLGQTAGPPWSVRNVACLIFLPLYPVLQGTGHFRQTFIFVPSDNSAATSVSPSSTHDHRFLNMCSLISKLDCHSNLIFI